MKSEESSSKPIKFLLSSHISKERLEWLQACIPSGPHSKGQDASFDCTLYLCGDALYSLFHPDTAPIWRELGDRQGFYIVVESEDYADMGLLSLSEEPGFFIQGDRSVLFMSRGDAPVRSAGFLHLYSPYMHRHTDQFLACITQAVSLSVPVSVILYLDGVHLCHTNQLTSEFDNIEEGLDRIQVNALKAGIPVKVTACQRCSQARGYFHHNAGEDPKAPCFRREVEISGLSQLIPPFSSADVVLSADCMNCGDDGDEAYIIVISGTPYGTEHTFGAISFAVALAGKNIRTYVLFVEDGAYCYIPAPESQFRGTVRDIHSVIEATAMPDLLEYAVLESSLYQRGIPLDQHIPEFQVIKQVDVVAQMERLVSGGYHVRMLIW